MVVTPNMGLKVWNLLSDLFQHADLQDNWDAIDTHNHTSGSGSQIPTGGILDAAITTLKLANGSVTTAKLATSAVTTATLADSSVTTGKLADEAVTETKIADGAVTATKILNGSITTTQIAPNANITLAQLATGVGRLHMLATSTSGIAVSGTMHVVAAGSGLVLVLPSPTPDAVVGICTTTNHPTIVESADPIYLTSSLQGGTPLTYVHAFTAGANGNTVVLQSDGTSWYLIHGVQDTGWVSITTFHTSVSAGAGGLAPIARLVGNRVSLTGAVNVTPGFVSGQLFDLPSAFMAPAKAVEWCIPDVAGSSMSLPELSQTVSLLAIGSTSTQFTITPVTFFTD